jgi:hypothetical protein
MDRVITILDRLSLISDKAWLSDTKLKLSLSVLIVHWLVIEAYLNRTFVAGFFLFFVHLSGFLERIT